MIDAANADGTEKADGCFLSAGLNSETSSLIVANLNRLADILRSL